MTKGYYVAARIDAGTANQRVAYLCGPFFSLNAAMMMVEPVRRAALRSDEQRYKFASFSGAKLSRDKLPAGSLDLSFLRLDDILQISYLHTVS